MPGLAEARTSAGHKPIDYLRHALSTNRRVILASNRGPVDYTVTDGDLQARRGAGGVVTALAGLCQYTKVSWVSAAMSNADRLAASRPDLPHPAFLSPNLDHRFVIVPEDVFNRHYNVLSNPFLWFIHHYLWNIADGPRVDQTIRDAWENGYVTVNRAFAETLAPLVRHRPGELLPFVLIHDYQLYLVAHYLRQTCPHAVLSHFVHIPWPAPSYWQLLPRDMRDAILESLCQVDVIGFQTPRFARNFLNCCEDFLPDATVDLTANTVEYQGHLTRVRVYPISVDVPHLEQVAASAICNRYYEKLRPAGHRKTIVRVDRLEPSKNIVRGFEAFRTLLVNRPDLHGEVTFMAFLVPSRTKIPEYQRYRERVMAIVNEINTRFGTTDWVPIDLHYENNFIQAVAGMRLADVFLVNPVMDGMNLVAKEAMIVNENQAALVLSEAAGASFQMGKDALMVSPGDIDGTAEALARALAMPRAERAVRAQALRRAVKVQDLNWWVSAQVQDLQEIALERETTLGTAALA